MIRTTLKDHLPSAERRETVTTSYAIPATRGVTTLATARAGRETADLAIDTAEGADPQETGGDLPGEALGTEIGTIGETSRTGTVIATAILGSETTEEIGIATGAGIEMTPTIAEIEGAQRTDLGIGLEIGPETDMTRGTIEATPRAEEETPETTPQGERTEGPPDREADIPREGLRALEEETT